jgi:hypothetical protein
MFSVNIAARTHSAGDMTWHRSLISIRGLSRLLIFFISYHVKASLGPQMPRYQYRKWAIAAYSRRLLAKLAAWGWGFWREKMEQKRILGYPAIIDRLLRYG